MGNLKFGMSQQRLIVDENLGLGELQCTYVGYFWCPIPWVWFGSFGALCKISDSMFFETLLRQKVSSDFNQLHTRCHNQGLIQDITFLADLKILWHFEMFFNTEPYGAGNFKSYSSYSFHLIWAKLYDKYGSHRGILSHGYFGDLPKMF